MLPFEKVWQVKSEILSPEKGNKEDVKRKIFNLFVSRQRL